MRSAEDSPLPDSVSILRDTGNTSFKDDFKRCVRVLVPGSREEISCDLQAYGRRQSKAERKSFLTSLCSLLLR